MDDAELIRLCAEKVMGWELISYEEMQTITSPPARPVVYTNPDDLAKTVWYLGPPEENNFPDWFANYPWNPLTDDADACAVLDKMAETFEIQLIRSADQMLAGAEGIWWSCGYRPYKGFVETKRYPFYTLVRNGYAWHRTCSPYRNYAIVGGAVKEVCHRLHDEECVNRDIVTEVESLLRRMALGME